MGQDIRFMAGRASRHLADPARRHLDIDEERDGAVADVRELPVQDVTRLHRPIGMLAFQGLHPGHVIRAQRCLATCSAFLGGLVQGIDVGDRLI